MAEPTPEINPETPQPEVQDGKIVLSEESLKKMIQSEADRVATHHFKEKKALEKELDDLRKAQMNAEQVKEFERKQLETRLTEKERELNLKEISIKSRDLLTAAELPLTFVNFIRVDTPDAVEGEVAKIKSEWQKAIAAAVDSRMKTAGRDPNKDRDGTAPSSEIAGMTPAQIQQRGRSDPEWFRKHEPELMAAVAAGKYKK